MDQERTGKRKGQQMSDPDLVLSWPQKELWPNSRAHRMRKAAVVRENRTYAGWATTVSKRKFPADAHIQLTFRPNTNRRYDLDNALAACKSYLDGIADASMVDDSGWAISIRKGERWELSGLEQAGGVVEVRLIR